MIRKHHIAERYETPAGEVECQIYFTLAGKPDAIATVERSRLKGIVQGSFPYMIGRESQSETAEVKGH